jgi:hypothetical protein
MFLKSNLEKLTSDEKLALQYIVSKSPCGGILQEHLTWINPKYLNSALKEARSIFKPQYHFLLENIEIKLNVNK